MLLNHKKKPLCINVHVPDSRKIYNKIVVNIKSKIYWLVKASIS